MADKLKAENIEFDEEEEAANKEPEESITSSESEEEKKAEEEEETLPNEEGDVADEIVTDNAPLLQIDREEYVLAFKELVQERNQLLLKNNLLHRRLAEYYKKRKMDHVLKPMETAADVEEKFQQKLFAYEELKYKQDREEAEIKQKILSVKDKYFEELKRAEKKFNELQQHERSTGSGLIYARKGKPISDKVVERFLTLQRDKTKQASAMMLKYIRLRNAVSEQEAIVRKLEKVGPDLYVAQYEELRIEKLNYTNKIEERDDELIKNRSKCTEHNMILAHIREKMHHTSEIIDINECDLGDAEIEFQRAREDLTTVKTHRDRLRWSLEAEARKAGLLTRRDLLRDFQDSEDMVISLREKKERLKEKMAKYNLALRGLRKADKSGPTSSSYSPKPPMAKVDTVDLSEDLPPFSLI